MRLTRTKTPPSGRATALAPPALLAPWVLLALWILIAVPGAVLAAPRAWTPLPAPWDAPATVNDIAAAGAGGRAALSLNGGATWANRSPAAQGVVVGDGGTLLVTSNGGRI